VTRTEFDTWIEQHYTELLKVARKRVNSDDAAQDAVQSAVAGMLDSTPFMGAPIEYAWPRAVKFVTSMARHQRISSQRVRALKTESKILLPAARLHGWKRSAAPRAE
jgi:DNA-directed RNA polymerase specialized sigma24 family protein